MPNVNPRGLIACPHCHEKFAVQQAAHARTLAMAEAINGGATREFVGAEWGVSPAAVYLALRMAGLGRPPRTERRDTNRFAVFTLMREGVFDLKEIASRTGVSLSCTRSYMWQARNEHPDIAAAYDKQKAEQQMARVMEKQQHRVSTRKAQILALRKAGLTLEQIGAALGVTRERVRQIQRNALIDAEAIAAVSAEEAEP